MSPAFINRFEVIVLEDQLSFLNENNFKDLIKFKLKYFQNEFYNNNKYKNQIDEKNKKKKEKHKKAYKNVIIEDNNINNENPFKDIIENNTKIYKSISKKRYEDDNELINLVYEKIKILKKYKCPFENNEGIEIDENSKKYLSFSSLSKLCRTVIIYLNRFAKSI